jgi:hypothetical protein
VTSNQPLGFLLGRRGEASVTLDMAAEYGDDGLRGKLAVTSEKFVPTVDVMKMVSCPTIGTPTVATITDLISRDGRDRYIFTEDFEGCLTRMGHDSPPPWRAWHADGTPGERQA